MGVSLLGAKRVRQLRVAVADDSVEHAFVVAHHQHWVAWFSTSDHRHGWHDSKTGAYAFLGPGEEQCWSSCERFPDYRERLAAQFVRDQS